MEYEHTVWHDDEEIVRATVETDDIVVWARYVLHAEQCTVEKPDEHTYIIYTGPGLIHHVLTAI